MLQKGVFVKARKRMSERKTERKGLDKNDLNNSVDQLIALYYGLLMMIN
jgi:hypothetical protein